MKTAIAILCLAACGGIVALISTPRATALAESAIPARAAACAGETGDAQIRCYDSVAADMYPLTHDSLVEAYRLCGLLGKDETGACLIQMALSAYAKGSRDFSAQLCASLPTSKEQSTCVQTQRDIRVLNGFWTRP